MIYYLLAGQKRLEDEYKYPGVLPKVNKADMQGQLRSSKNISDHAVVSLELLLHTL